MGWLIAGLAGALVTWLMFGRPSGARWEPAAAAIDDGGEAVRAAAASLGLRAADEDSRGQRLVDQRGERELHVSLARNVPWNGGYVVTAWIGDERGASDPWRGGREEAPYRQGLDHAFDAAFEVRGSAHDVVARLDDATRAELVAMPRPGPLTLEVGAGGVRVRSPDVPMTERARWLEPVVRVARLLSSPLEPADRIARLTRIGAQDRSPAARLQALTALRGLQPLAADAEDALFDLLVEDAGVPPELQRTLAARLAAAPEASRLAGRLRRLVDDRAPSAAGALEALLALGHPELAGRVAAAGDADTELAIVAAQALGRSRSDDAEERLLHLLDPRDARVVAAAASELRERGTRRALRPLRRLLERGVLDPLDSLYAPDIVAAREAVRGAIAAIVRRVGEPDEGGVTLAAASADEGGLAVAHPVDEE